MITRQQNDAILDTAILDVAILDLSKYLTDGKLTDSIGLIEP